jgi:uncharacterized protein (TIGR02145 family)
MQYLTTAGTKGICPDGWHIPTYAEFDTLIATVGNNGNSLKAIGQGIGGGIGTNTSSFSALLSGYHEANGSFNNLNINTYFWSSSTGGTGSEAINMSVYNDGDNIYVFNYSKSYGYCIRCIKD